MERDGEDWFFVAAAGSATMSRDGSLTVRDPFMWTPEGAEWIRKILEVSLVSRGAPAHDWHLSARDARRVRERQRAHYNRDRYDVRKTSWAWRRNSTCWAPPRGER